MEGSVVDYIYMFFFVIMHLKGCLPGCACHRGMEKILHKRRRLLSYLRESDFKAYSVCISNLGLADVFGVSVSTQFVLLWPVITYDQCH